jgi:hypothetical protein
MRERGTIAAWNAMGVGRVRVANGDSLHCFYWCVIRGFGQLTVGQRVEFSRGVGLRRNVADLVMAVPEEVDLR